MSSYFAGVMVRLMLTLTPVVCVSAAMAISTLLDTYVNPVEPADPDAILETISNVSVTTTTTASAPPNPSTPSKKSKKNASAAKPSTLGESLTPSTDVPETSTQTGNDVPKYSKANGIFGTTPRIMVVLNTVFMLSMFVLHCTWVTSNAYSSPSVVLSSKNPDGSMHIIDDFREAYYWLRQNTAEDAVILSWWDYGYQIAGMADRPTLVDNNTWNNSKQRYL